MTTRRLGFVGSVLMVTLASQAAAQSTARLQVAASMAASLDSNACRVDRTWQRTLPSSATNASSDTLIIAVVADSSFDSTKAAKLFVPLEVHLETRNVASVPKDSSLVRVAVGPAGLLEQRISLWAPHAIRVCLVEPFPPRPLFAQAKPFTTHTDVIASGEVSNALRSGAQNSAATGSLGIHHSSYPRPGEALARFPWYFLPQTAPDTAHRIGRTLYKLAHLSSFPLSGEELRAVISVASAIDSVTGPAGQAFAQSVLLPSTAPRSAWKSVDLSYAPFYMFGHAHQTIGPAFRLIAAESRWSPDGVTPATTKVAVLVATDVRLRAVVINRVSTADDNNLSLALDGGYIQRSVGGDAIDEPSFLKAALGDDTRHRFSGWALGTSLTLRQVTGYADFQCLSCGFIGLGGRKGRHIESLEGLQPVIGFRFEAPFFTLGGE